MNTPTKATNPGDKPAEQALNTQSTKTVAPGGATAIADPDNPKPGAPKAAEKAVPDDEFEKARLEKDNVLSAEDQKAIDAAHGASPEIEREGRSHSSLESDVKNIQERDRNIRPRLERFCEDNEHPVAVITKLVRDIPSDTPDDHIVWGASGHKLRMGHLRALVMGIGPR